jgi:hypothetical protein
MGVTGRSLCWALNLGALAGALGVAAAEGWDVDGDGTLTVREALLVGVRLLAFPVHVLLRLAPAPLLGLLGIPERAPWPSNAAVAVAASLPMWGLFVTGGLVAAAWLEMALDARHARARGAGPYGPPPPP